jgi:hypothetical protein
MQRSDFFTEAELAERLGIDLERLRQSIHNADRLTRLYGGHQPLYRLDEVHEALAASKAVRRGS